MKILLDECVPRKLAGELTGHEVSTVPKMAWAGIRNGVLLSLIEREAFEAFLTVDLDDLKKLVPSILKALSDSPKEHITHIAP